MKLNLKFWKPTEKPIIKPRKPKNPLPSKQFYLKTTARKKLAYNGFAKEIITENPGLMKEITKLSKAPRKTIFIDPKGNYKLKVITTDPSHNQLYKLELKHKNKKYLFFIKEKPFIKSIDEFENTYRELIAAKIVENAGFNIIQPHFAINLGTKSYIAYDFTKLITLDRAKSKIGIIPYLKIDIKLHEITEQLKRYKLWDIINADNVYINLITKKIYLADIMSAKEDNELTEIAKKELGFIEK